MFNKIIKKTTLKFIPEMLKLIKKSKLRKKKQ